MDKQNTSVPNNSHLRLTLKDSAVHHFQNRNKTTLAQGTCRIYETDTTDIETPSQEKSYVLTVKKFRHTINSSAVFIRINYPQNTTYLFEKQNHTVCSISFTKNSGYQEFDRLMSQFSNVIQYNSTFVTDKLREKINQHCPVNIQTKDITDDFRSKVKKLGRFIGIVAGKAENVVSKPAKTAASSISQRADRISRQSISQNAHSKWNAVKNTSSKINQTLSQVVTPVINKYRDFQDYIGQGFRSSDNKLIKTVREYSQAFSNSINEAEKSTHQQQNHTELKQPSETSSIQLK